MLRQWLASRFGEEWQCDQANDKDEAHCSAGHAKLVAGQSPCCTAGSEEADELRLQQRPRRRDEPADVVAEARSRAPQMCGKKLREVNSIASK